MPKLFARLRRRQNLWHQRNTFGHGKSTQTINLMRL